jgi:hypothetical protein
LDGCLMIGSETCFDARLHFVRPKIITLTTRTETRRWT